jgi:hypothetical protein
VNHMVERRFGGERRTRHWHAWRVSVSIKRFLLWCWHVFTAIRKEPGLLILLVVTPFLMVSLLILNQRVSMQAALIAELREDISHHKAESHGLTAAGVESLSERLALVERTVYVDVPTEMEKRRQPAAGGGAAKWQLQRDEELRRRLLNLERWRAEQGNR